ncbi:disease resistance protein TAO1-like [Gossypium australe]|uniref:Disease resistance protein TAO1-like n=1 Tax=Gossypium australe TaxID=47621 RepID=A0A5B6VTB0_9ROSI|nr:disease resistance protein TAO1-like [Gossypium australe]
MGIVESLRHLYLSETALKELPSSIENLIGLKELSLLNCESLVCLLDSFYKLKSLSTFDLEDCSRLEIFPEVMDTMEELYELDLRRTALKELPSSIGNLIGLESLRLKNCENLVCLPDSFYKLKSLRSFYLHGCSRWEIFPEVMDTMEMLRYLDLSGTALKELQSSIGNLIDLKDLVMNKCKNLVCLPDNFYKLKSLERFHLEGCSRLEIFSEVMDTMEMLRYLDLSETALKELPSSIDNLIGLTELRLSYCEDLVCLPDSFYKLKSLKRFNVLGCSRLEIFPEVMDTMEKLHELDLSGTALKELPSSIDNLIRLAKLCLNNSENLVCLPSSFCKLKSLRVLYIRGISNLVVKNLFTTVGCRPVKQKDFHGLSSLYRLDLSESNLKNLPTTIKQFLCLKDLILRKCKRLKSLPELPPSLVYLDAHDCTSLEDVSSIKKVFEQALFCGDGLNRQLKLIFTNCFQLNEKGRGNGTSVEEVSSIKKRSKRAVFCKSLGWLFTNCFQLDQKAVSSPETPKLEMPFEHLVTVLTDYHQATPESEKRTSIVTCVPGSEIPEWFDFKSLGSSIYIQLPSEWCSNNSRINFSCFVASVVVSFLDSYNGMEFGIRCKCHLKSCNGDSHYLSCYVSSGFESGLSDHLFLLYGGEEVRGLVKSEASNKRFYNEASFSFYLDDGETLRKWIWSECKVKQCGVHLLFAN